MVALNTETGFTINGEDAYGTNSPFWGVLYPPLIHQGLYERNRTDNFAWTPLIAKSLPIWSNGNKTATVEIRTDVTFADGHPPY